MDQRYRINVLIVVLAAIAVPGVAYLLMLDHGSRLEDYVCLNCAVKQRHFQKWRWILKTKDTNVLTDTPVSSRLKPLRVSACRHRWKLTYLDFHGRSVSGHGSLGGIVFEMLCLDPTVGNQLAEVAATNAPLSETIWARICEASFRENPSCDVVFEWLDEGEDREPLCTWLRKLP